MFIVPTNRLVGLEKIKGIPNSAVWMLAVDGKFFSKEEGPRGFDSREPGSVQGILNGFLAALQELQKSDALSIEMLQHVHNVCLSGIKTQNPAIPGVFRTTSVGFEIMPGWASLEGLKNLITDGYTVCQGLPIQGSPDRRAVDLENPLTLDNIETHFQKESKLFYIPPVEEIGEKLNSAIKEFNSIVSRLKASQKDFNPDLLLLTITRLVQNLTRTHAFRDGNNRTFVNNLLNALLIQNGFYPGIFNDPNIFEFHTVSELLPLIKAAIATSEKAVTEPDATIFDYNHSATPEAYTAMGSAFLLQIDSLIKEAQSPASEQASASAEPSALTKLYVNPSSTPLMFKPAEENDLSTPQKESTTSIDIRPM